MKFRFSSHAVEELEERAIPIQVIMTILNDPDQILPEKKGGTVDNDYRTSKLTKYQGEE